MALLHETMTLLDITSMFRIWPLNRLQKSHNPGGYSRGITVIQNIKQMHDVTISDGSPGVLWQGK